MFYSRKKRIEDSFPDEAESIISIDDGEFLITNVVPESIPIEIRPTVVTILQETRGFLLVLSSVEVQRLDLSEIENNEVEDQDGRAFVLNDRVLPLSIVGRVICLGIYDYEQLKSQEDRLDLVKAYKG